MNIQLIIAGYAAVVATAAAAFQIWQARKARRPQIELELIHTQYREGTEPYLAVFLEARNRGNHPVRIVAARIGSSKVQYDFRPQSIDITTAGLTISVPDEIDTKKTSSAEMPPLPGIILPGDGASRMISNRMIPAADATKIAETFKDKLGNGLDDFFRVVDDSLRDELYGGVEPSTGEFIHTKPAKYDWDAAWRSSQST